MSQIPLNLDLVKDVILLLVSGVACIYCMMLNKRLKGLSSLKKGVGASIVSLTEAIQNTHVAAQKAQDSTLDSVKMLRELIEKAGTLSIQLEAVTIDAERRLKSARTLDAALEEKVTTTLPNCVAQAQSTASNLLKVVNDIERYKNDLTGRSSPKVVSIDAPSIPLNQDYKPVESVVTREPNKPSEKLSTLANIQAITPEMAKTSIEDLFDEMEALAEKAGIKRSGLLSRLKQARS